MKAQNCFNIWVVLHNKYQRNPKQGIIHVLFLLLFILTYNPDLKSQVQYTAPDYHQFIMTNYNNGFVKIGMNQFLAGVDEHQKRQDKLEEGHDYVVDYTFIPEGYNCQKLYQPDIMEAIAAMNDNPLFYIYSGHGSFKYLAGGSFSIFESNIEGATNTIFPFIFSFACITGNFAYSEPCIG
ncbi:MAG: C25 family cysteine peptidase, partial [Bacteroidales bacterium]|nr:C25 family cysteine peptidase [Bacteroidales bacterium]